MFGGNTANEPLDVFFDYLTFTKTTYFDLFYFVRGYYSLFEGKSID